MSVIRTDRWLLASYNNPLELCEKLTGYFNGAQAFEIYDYFLLNGMYVPLKNGKKNVKQLQENQLWEIVANETEQLQRVWNGPDIPIFIFPSDVNNQKLIEDFNGKSGLAFDNKLFLFLSEHNKEKEIRAMVTHEYNHVCRLSKYKKKEEDYVLLDTIILEGLAENSVKERYGEEWLADWTSYYTTEQLENMWRKIVYPNRNILKAKDKHHEILFGFRHYPKMVGYCVGYYLVKKYMESNSLSSQDIFGVKTDEIAQLNK